MDFKLLARRNNLVFKLF